MLRLLTGKMKWVLSDGHLSPVDWPVGVREDPFNDEEKYECSPKQLWQIQMFWNINKNVPSELQMQMQML